MVCLYCGSKTSVSNSRSSDKGLRVWRRRYCPTCGAIFSTGESIDWSSSLRVKTKKGTLEPFYRDKLFLSVYRSLSHRKSAYIDAGELTLTILSKSLPSVSSGTLQTSVLLDKTSEVMGRFDKAAQTHYLAHHK